MKKTVNIKEKVNVVHGQFRRGILVRIFHKIKMLIERRNTIRQLSALSDRMLNDIGIDRVQINSLVNRRGKFSQIISSRTEKPDTATDFRRAA